MRLTVRNTDKYLEHWGLTPQRPLKRVYEQSSEAVSKWPHDTYPAITQRAKREGAGIHWDNESSLPSDDLRGRGNAPEG
jgi:Winged helix-turn helix